MKAKEAREKALKVNIDYDGGQYKKIILEISEAANRGEYEIWFYSPIKKDVRGRLVDDGYDVGLIQSERNETMTKIKWS